MTPDIATQAAVRVLRAYVAQVDEVNCQWEWCGNPRPHVTGNCLGFPDAIADEADAIEAGDEESPLWKPIISVAGLYELCWTQPVDRFVACDRAKDHKGKHSWELPS